MGRRGRVRIAVGFTIACVFGSYHHLTCEFEFHMARCTRYNIM